MKALVEYKSHSRLVGDDEVGEVRSTEGASGDVCRRQLRDYAAALAWVGGLISTTERGMLSRPTPCSEWDVRMLVGHLIGTGHRASGTAIGVPATEIPHVVTDVPDDELGAVYVQLASEVVPAFAGFEEATLVRAPWGQVSALDALRGFTVETATHGWDLAVATGRPADTPSGIAERCLEFAPEVVPARLRGTMYADPIADSPEASSTERLARLLGHH